MDCKTEDSEGRRNFGQIFPLEGVRTSDFVFPSEWLEINHYCRTGAKRLTRERIDSPRTLGPVLYLAKLLQLVCC